MAAAPLVGAQIDAGKRVMVVLDRERFRVDAALSFYYPEPAEWRLLIASPLVDRFGPMSTYQRLHATGLRGHFAHLPERHIRREPQ